MAQKLVTESLALGRALDEAGNVGHDERHALVHPHDAELGFERCEVVVCNFGLCRRHHGQQRGLSDVRKADQPHVRKQFELEDELELLPSGAALGKARALAGGGREVAVAPAPLAAAADDKPLVTGHVLDDLAALGLLDDGAARHFDHKVRRGFARAVFCGAVGPVLGDVLFAVFEVDQGVEMVVHDEHHVAAVAAVAAVRPAGRHILLAVKRDGSVAAVSRSHADFCNINKHALTPLQPANRFSQQKISDYKNLRFFKLCLSLLGNDVVDAHALSVLAYSLKFHFPVHLGEQGVVAAAADVDAGMDLGSSLANQDVAGQNELTVRSLDAEALGLAVTAVLSGTDAFFMGKKLQS